MGPMLVVPVLTFLLLVTAGKAHPNDMVLPLV